MVYKKYLFMYISKIHVPCRVHKFFLFLRQVNIFFLENAISHKDLKFEYKVLIVSGDEALALTPSFFKIPSKSHFYIINGFQIFNTVTSYFQHLSQTALDRSLLSAKVLFINRVYQEILIYMYIRMRM